MEKIISNINPYTFTGSAILIGLILTQELSLEEQDSIGNWLQLVGQIIQTYASQSDIINSNNNNKEININTIKKTLKKIEKELNKIKDTST